MKPLLQLTALAFALATMGCSDNPANSSQSSRNSVARIATPAPALSLGGRVTDAAHLLSPDQAGKLAAKLKKLEIAIHHQLVVVTVPNLGGRDVSDYARDLGNSWGIGRKGYNDGIMLLVAPREHKIRIAVGHGLEKKLTNELCHHIIVTEILPLFRRGNLPGGIEAGSDALIARLNKLPVRPVSDRNP